MTTTLTRRKNTAINLDGPNNEWRTWVEDLANFQRNGCSSLGSSVAASKATTNFPIISGYVTSGHIISGYTISGHIISVKMAKSDATLFKYMMNSQWVITVIGAMSGGADPPELLEFYQDDESSVFD
ncbi:hypothetical protein AK830_g232 [Neonectria ditissima]|uniref:Uncharacterized protein n=1 Tax=Neonectria ditissima TaxID=78410 RepID=A0A0P7BY51_9HYPO|nr:hypothetical protein AK830_g232 [Neonectria ditissima]